MAETAKPPPTLYYIRHGETDWNVTSRLQGRHDVPLNARGRKQATQNIAAKKRNLEGDRGSDFLFASL